MRQRRARIWRGTFGSVFALGCLLAIPAMAAGAVRYASPSG
jgi:ABC-type transporter Mla subunit MlaD